MQINYQNVKKQVLILTIFLLIIKIGKKKAYVKAPYIYHSIEFKKDINNIKTLFKFGNEIKAITLTKEFTLGSSISCNNMTIQNIDKSNLAIF